MSVKTLDRAGRWRNKTVSFRMSSVEVAELDVLVSISGLSKQDYIIARLLNRELSVEANSRIYKALRNQMGAIYRELRRLKRTGDMPLEMQEIIESLSAEFIDLGNESKLPDIETDRALINNMKRK